MKKSLFLLILSLVCGATLVIQSCRKNSTESPGTDLLRDKTLFTYKAKIWFNIKSGKSLLARGQTNKILEPKWNESYLETDKSGQTALVVPAQKFILANKTIDIERVFRFTFTGDEVQDGLILEFYGSSQFIFNNKTKLAAGYRNNSIQGFDGSIILYNINYRYLNGISFRDGSRINAKVRVEGEVKAPLNVKAPTNVSKRLGPTMRTMNEGSDCYSRYLVTTYSDGRETWEYMYSWCNGGDGAGTPGGTTQTVSAADPVDAYEVLLFSNKINLAEKFECFNQVASAGATYTAQLSADLPQNDVPSALLGSDLSPGHAFITLTKSNNGVSVTQTFGFYPENGLKSTLMTRVTSQIANDAIHEYDASISMSMTEEGFDNLKATALLEAAEKYDLNDYNCTDYALNVFNAGRSTPIVVPDWIGPGSGSNYGTTPNGLYQTIQGMHNSGVPNTTVGPSMAPYGTPCN